MANKKEQEAQTRMFEFTSHQLSLDDEAYGIVSKIKTQLIIKHKRPFNFSDAIRELNNRTKEVKGGK